MECEMQIEKWVWRSRERAKKRERRKRLEVDLLVKGMTWPYGSEREID